MSVPLRDRSESEIDYHYDAVMVDQSLIQLMLRDFGVKDKPKSVNYYTKINKMSRKDADQFKAILDRNNLDMGILQQFPSWLLDYFRDDLLKTSGRMVYDVQMASRLEQIGITNYNEFLKRQEYQDLALAECQNILRQLQRVMKNLPVDAEKLMPFTGQILKLEQEISNWRKNCNQQQNKYKAN